MTILEYSPQWDHFLSALFVAYADKILSPRRSSLMGESLFPQRTHVHDPDLAARTEAGIRRLGKGLLDHFYNAWLSEQEDIEDFILAALRHGYRLRRNPMGDMLHPAVAKVEKAAAFCGKEAHRMLQFARFVKTPEGVYIADITPDCDVLTLIADHFHGRFGDQSLMIRDLKRGKAILSHPSGWELTSLGAPPYPPLPPDGQFEDLWRSYFKAIANPARRNLKLQQHFVPLKYRTHLTEFQEYHRS